MAWSSGSADGVPHRPERGGQRIEPVQMTPHLSAVSGPGRRDDLFCGGREPVQPDLYQDRGAGTAHADAGRGADRDFCFGEDRPGRLGDLDDGPAGKRRVGLTVGDHPQREQVRLAARLMGFYRFGDGHGLGPFHVRHDLI